MFNSDMWDMMTTPEEVRKYVHGTWTAFHKHEVAELPRQEALATLKVRKTGGKKSHTHTHAGVGSAGSLVGVPHPQLPLSQCVRGAAVTGPWQPQKHSDAATAVREGVTQFVFRGGGGGGPLSKAE